MRIILSLVIFLLALSFGPIVSAQSVHQDLQERVKAQIIEILDERDREIVGTGATTTVQTVRAELLDGSRAGTVATFENEVIMVSVGDKVFLNRLEFIDGTELIQLHDVERRPQMLIVFVFFMVLVVLFAGWQGIRSVLSLSLSLGAILFLLVPALLAGYSPALVSFVVAGFILAVILFLTHGFRPHVVIAFFGTFSAVAVTCLIAWWVTSSMRFTGLTDDASVFLNFATGGSLDFAGLLLGGIIIGLLGVLDDVSITQASVVHELRRANQSLSMWQLYNRAIAVGRDHIGSLVNTLALAYVGASLPLVLLFARANSDLMMSLNQEVVAAELMRIIVGSIGLILAVPLTTLLAAWYFKDKILDEEVHSACGHTHHH